MTDEEKVFEKVSDEEITDLMEHIAEDVDITMKKQLEDDELAAVCEILDYSRKSGGKRLRPTLAVLTSQALGGDYQETLDMATTAEMLHGACLTADARVLKSDGMVVPITEIVPGDEVLTIDTETGLHKKCKVTNLFDNGIRPIYKLNLKNRSIKCTANHPFLVIRYDKAIFHKVKPEIKDIIKKDRKMVRDVYTRLECPEHMVYHWIAGIAIEEKYVIKLEDMFGVKLERFPAKYSRRRYYFEWVPLSELKKGDLIVIQKELPETPDCAPPIEFGSMDPIKLCQIIGLFIGDGCYLYKDRGLSFSLDKITADAYLPIISEVFEKKPVFNKANGFQYNICSIGIAKFFRELGIVDGSHKKRVPKWIFSLPKALKCAFMRGIIDSDGCVQKVGDCGIAFVSEKLTEDVKFLLDTMGFTVSKVFSCTRSNAHFKRGSKKETTLYHIIVSNPEQIKMKIGSYKKLSMERMTRKNRHRYMFENRFLDCSTIPIKDTRTFGLNRVHDVVALGEEHVYDLRVEGAHNFIANNIVVHNSLGYDDVLDGDLLRRGKPSAHAMFGAGAAMMGSNLLALLALKMGTVRGLPLIRLLISAASNLALGSTEEQLFHEYSEDRYYRIIGLKTASLFQAPCEIGAIVAGVVRPQFVLASRYGWNVGMLYQITDDLVDILKTHLTGEPHGHMKNGSPTLAFIHAARTTKDSHIGTLLQKFINDAPLPMEEFEEVYKALVAAGSIEYTFKKIEEHNKLCHKQCALMPQNKFSNYLAAMPGYMHRALMSEVKGYEGLEGMKAPETPESKEPEKPAGV